MNVQLWCLQSSAGTPLHCGTQTCSFVVSNVRNILAIFSVDLVRDLLFPLTFQNQPPTGWTMSAKSCEKHCDTVRHLHCIFFALFVDFSCRVLRFPSFETVCLFLDIFSPSPLLCTLFAADNEILNLSSPQLRQGTPLQPSLYAHQLSRNLVKQFRPCIVDCKESTAAVSLQLWRLQAKTWGRDYAPLVRPNSLAVHLLDHLPRAKVSLDSKWLVKGKLVSSPNSICSCGSQESVSKRQKRGYRCCWQ